MIGRALQPPVVWPVGWWGALPDSSASTGDFDTSPITDPRAYQEVGGLHVAWDSTAPAGSWYQVYVNARLAWEGRETYCDIPFRVVPGETIHFDIGIVGSARKGVDFSATLGGPSNRAQLTWFGGRYLDPGLRGYRVYASRSPGVPYDPTNRVATVPGPIGGVWLDGYGAAGYGSGNFAYGAIPYVWISGPLTTGSWQFAVAAYDVAGNEDPDPPTEWVDILVPPPEVSPRADGSRLWIRSYDQATGTYTLAWNPIA